MLVILNIRFQGSTAPRVLFTDRGNGFFNSGTGAVTNGYRDALKNHNLRSFFKDSAAVQPGELQEIMLHETAVAWMRQRLTKTRPKQAWALPRLRGAERAERPQNQRHAITFTCLWGELLWQPLITLY